MGKNPPHKQIDFLIDRPTLTRSTHGKNPRPKQIDFLFARPTLTNSKKLQETANIFCRALATPTLLRHPPHP